MHSEFAASDPFIQVQRPLGKRVAYGIEGATKRSKRTKSSATLRESAGGGGSQEKQMHILTAKRRNITVENPFWHGFKGCKGNRNRAPFLENSHCVAEQTSMEEEQ